MLAMALLACALVWAREPSAFIGEPWIAATFDRPAALALLLVRVALLLLVLGTGRPGVLVGATFVVSLAVRAALGPYVVVAALVASRRVFAAQRDSATSRGAWLALAAILAAFVVELSGARAAHPRVPERLDTQVTYFADRENVFRARAAARDWCRLEHPPDAGCEVFARLRNALPPGSTP